MSYLMFRYPVHLTKATTVRPPTPQKYRNKAPSRLLSTLSHNISYVSTHKTDKVCTADGKCYNYNDVFVDEVDPGYSNTCGQTCYVACSCNTSNGWYSSCLGSDCFLVTDTRYAGQPNAASASRSLSDIGSISASGANSGISASAAANSGISTLASGATTCYKKKTCSEGGYFDSVPAGKKCPEVAYNGYTCYDTNCTNACPDGWFSADSRPVVTHMLFLESLNNPGCYQASCAPGYSTTVNGAVVAEYQGVKCYKDLAPDTIYFSFSNSHCHKAIGGGGNYHCLRMSASLRKDGKPLAYQIDDVKLPANVTLLIGNDYCVGRSCLPISYVSQQIHLSNGSDGTINGFRGSCMQVGGSNTGAGGALSDQITYQITNVSNSGLGANEDTMEIILKGKTYTVSIDFDSTKKSCSPNSAGSWVHDESFCVLGNCTILPGY
mgnify:CR=1 FL=1